MTVQPPTDDADDAGAIIRKVDDKEPCGLLVFKTMTDPFSGRITFFKVISGVVKNDATRRELHPPRPGAPLPPGRHAGPQGR